MIAGLVGYTCINVHVFQLVSQLDQEMWKRVSELRLRLMTLL